MQSKAATVDQYLAELPHDRRAAIGAVRRVILDNLDPGFAEGMQYGMIGYHVPHATYPAGYHCDPKQPLPYAGLASQKQHMSLYLPLYVGPGAGALMMWFQSAWERTGKKLDMGKACVRFKKVEDLALDVIAETFRRLPLKVYIENYEQSLAARPGPVAREKIKAMVAERDAAKKKTAKKAGAKKDVARKAAAKKVTKRAAPGKSASKKKAARR